GLALLNGLVGWSCGAGVIDTSHDPTQPALVQLAGTWTQGTVVARTALLVCERAIASLQDPLADPQLDARQARALRAASTATAAAVGAAAQAIVLSGHPEIPSTRAAAADSVLAAFRAAALVRSLEARVGPELAPKVRDARIAARIASEAAMAITRLRAQDIEGAGKMTAVAFDTSMAARDPRAHALAAAIAALVTAPNLERAADHEMALQALWTAKLATRATRHAAAAGDVEGAIAGAAGAHAVAEMFAAVAVRQPSLTPLAHVAQR